MTWALLPTLTGCGANREGDPLLTAVESAERSTADRGGEAREAPFDLGAVVERVHFAYREAEGRFAGGHSTYAIEVDAAGAVVRPFHASGAQDGEGLHASPGEVREGAPLRLEVAGIERGGAALAQRGEGRAQVEEDGHLAIGRGEVVEHYRNRDDGVEQSWAFERAPSGTGALRVRVEASGLAYVGETASGLHFADAQTGLGFRYGHGTWIDAAGRETAVPAQWSNGGIELVVPSDVVAASRYPAVLDPIISPEIAMDEPVLAPFAGAENVSVASDGRDFLVVWSDARGGESTVVGTRVTAAGEVLDPTGLTIARGGTWPSVASNGSGYLVTFVRGTVIHMIRVGSDGVVPSSEVSLGYGNSAARVASNGSSYLVVLRFSYELSAKRVSADGALTDVGFWYLHGEPDHPPPDVASDGQDYFVVWHDRDWYSATRRVFGARVSGAGSIVDFPGRRLWTAESDQVHPSVAFNGSEYFVVWRTAREGRVDILGTRVSPSGELLTPSALLIGSGTVDSVPRVASDGAGALVTYEVGSPPELDVRAMRVTSAGAVVDPRGLVVCAAPGDQRTPVVTSNGSGYFVAWSDARNRSALPSVYGARVTSEGAVLEPDGVPLSRLPNEQTNPVAAWNGRHHLVAWVDARAGEGIYVARMSAGGEVLDAVPSMIAAGGRPIGLRVASNGENYFLVWQAVRIGVRSPVRGARVSAAGVVLDPTGFEISSWASSPDVAAAGREYLVVYRGDGIQGRRVSASGELLGSRSPAMARLASGCVSAPMGRSISSCGTKPTTPGAFRPHESRQRVRSCALVERRSASMADTARSWRPTGRTGSSPPTRVWGSPPYA